MPPTESSVIETLRRTDAFRRLPTELLGRLAQQGKRHVFAPGEVLFYQGETLRFCYLILRGRVVFQRRQPHAIDPFTWTERRRAVIIPDFPLDHRRSQDTAVAAEETEVLVLTDAALIDAMRVIPERAEAARGALGGEQHLSAGVQEPMANTGQDERGDTTPDR